MILSLLIAYCVQEMAAKPNVIKSTKAHSIISFIISNNRRKRFCPQALYLINSSNITDKDHSRSISMQLKQQYNSGKSVSYTRLLQTVIVPYLCCLQGFPPGCVWRPSSRGEVQRGRIFRHGDAQQTRHLHLHRRNHQHSFSKSYDAAVGHSAAM